MILICLCVCFCLASVSSDDSHHHEHNSDSSRDSDSHHEHNSDSNEHSHHHEHTSTSNQGLISTEPSENVTDITNGTLKNITSDVNNNTNGIINTTVENPHSSISSATLKNTTSDVNNNTNGRNTTVENPHASISNATLKNTTNDVNDNTDSMNTTMEKTTTTNTTPSKMTNIPSVESSSIKTTPIESTSNYTEGSDNATPHTTTAVRTDQINQNTDFLSPPTDFISLSDYKPPTTVVNSTNKTTSTENSNNASNNSTPDSSTTNKLNSGNLTVTNSNITTVSPNVENGTLPSENSTAITPINHTETDLPLENKTDGNIETENTTAASDIGTHNITVVPSNTTGTTGTASTTSQLEVNRTMQVCESLTVNVNTSYTWLPSAIPQLTCACAGTKGYQMCPEWQLVQGFDALQILQYETRRQGNASCSALFFFRIRPEGFTRRRVQVTLRCLAREEDSKDLKITIEKGGDKASCNVDDDCWSPSQECNNGTCKCASQTPAFIQDENECHTARVLGAACRFDEQCLYATSGSHCNAQTCACSDGFDNTDMGCSSIDRSLGDSCFLTRQCSGTNAICKSSRCQCEDGYQQKGQDCYQKVVKSSAARLLTCNPSWIAAAAIALIMTNRRF